MAPAMGKACGHTMTRRSQWHGLYKAPAPANTDSRRRDSAVALLAVAAIAGPQCSTATADKRASVAVACSSMPRHARPRVSRMPCMCAMHWHAMPCPQNALQHGTAAYEEKKTRAEVKTWPTRDKAACHRRRTPASQLSPADAWPSSRQSTSLAKVRGSGQQCNQHRSCLRDAPKWRSSSSPTPPSTSPARPSS